MRALFLLVPVALCSACPPVEGDDDDTPPPEVVSLGGITIQQGVGNYALTAFFGEPAASPGCTSEELAGCTLVSCVAADPVVLQSLDAGAITVETPTVSHTLALADGLYEVVSVPDAELFLNAEELTASIAGGADIAAVSFTLTAPTRIQLTAPPLQAVNVKVTNPIEIAWSNSSAGELSATLSNATFTLFATCEAPASAAALTIPAEVVGRFPLGSGRLDLLVSSGTTKNLDATSSVSFTAVSSVTSPTGGLAQYNVFFEAP